MSQLDQLKSAFIAAQKQWEIAVQNYNTYSPSSHAAVQQAWDKMIKAQTNLQHKEQSMAALSSTATALVLAFDTAYENVAGLHEKWQEEIIAALLFELAYKLKATEKIKQNIKDIAKELEAYAA